MGIELKEIDTGENGEYICSPDLEISGSGISTIGISEVISKEMGYNRKDSILKLLCSGSLLGDDGVYTLQDDTTYRFVDPSSLSVYLDVIDITEGTGSNSDKTILSVYGNTNWLDMFFGTSQGLLDNGYLMEIGTDLKISQYFDYKDIQVTFQGFSETSIRVLIDVTTNNKDYTFGVRYRESGSSVWSYINGFESIIDITGLEASKTYELEVVLNPYEGINWYSDPFVFHTKSKSKSGE